MTGGRAGRKLVLGLLALLIIAALAVFGLRSERGAGSPRPAPELPRESLIGAPLSLASFVSGAHGRPALVLFWASWCGPCKSEAPQVERFARTSQGRGRIVGVNWSDTLGGAKGFLAKYHWSFPDLRDGDGSVGNAYELTNLPTTFVIDRKGRIVDTMRGAQTEATLHAALAGAEAG